MSTHISLSHHFPSPSPSPPSLTTLPLPLSLFHPLTTLPPQRCVKMPDDTVGTAPCAGMTTTGQKQDDSDGCEGEGTGDTERAERQGVQGAPAFFICIN